MTKTVTDLDIPFFGTLGPDGTDHARATRRYIDFQGLRRSKIKLLEDPVAEGPEWVLGAANRFLIICSAHPRIHIVNEKYPQELVVIDTFIDATRGLGLVVRKDATEPRRLGLVEATHGYMTDLEEWKKRGSEILDMQSKPVISRMLLAGELDAGITYTALADRHPDTLHVARNYGEVNTTWVVFGNAERSPYEGDLIGHKIANVLRGNSPG